VRIGIGFDLHRLVRGRRLVLGGVEVPHAKGLLGHSDGDVILHALTDALLGAAGLGDIGELFPDTDPTHEGVDSRTFLEEALRRLAGRGFSVESVDLVVYAEEPKLSPHKPRIRASLAELLAVSIERVNVKAKTFEKLGPIGQGRAIGAHAAVLLAEPPAE
jgi:2-C-methyl-D-erythritol 2,4-cyclodiphosphate synthase